MHTRNAFFRVFWILGLALALCSCVKNGSESGPSAPVPIPATSPFATIQTGWTMEQAQKILGASTSTRTYIEGMGAYMQIFAGKDAYRAEALYKGQGRIIYGGSQEMSIQSYTVLEVLYNEEESGYFDKSTYPDGPLNRPVLTSEPKPGGTKTGGRRTRPTSSGTSKTSGGEKKDPPASIPSTSPATNDDFLMGI